jgi:hypothetical protein
LDKESTSYNDIFDAFRLPTFVLVASVAAIVTFTSLQIQQQAYAKGSLLDFAQGREDGKSAGKSDLLAGSSYNDNCPSGSGTSYCAGHIADTAQDGAWLRASRT